jgi:hypothetical protein
VGDSEERRIFSDTSDCAEFVDFPALSTADTTDKPHEQLGVEARKEFGTVIAKKFSR